MGLEQVLNSVYDDPEFVYKHLAKGAEFASLVSELKRVVEKDVIEQELHEVFESNSNVQDAIFSADPPKDVLRKLLQPILIQTESNVRSKAAQVCWERMGDRSSDICKTLHEQVMQAVHERMVQELGTEDRDNPKEVPPEPDASLLQNLSRQ